MKLHLKGLVSLHERSILPTLAKKLLVSAVIDS